MSGAENSKLPVIILDRDGTIVIDRNYLGDPAGLEFLPGAEVGLLRLHDIGCRMIVITNQSGIGRGLLSVEQVELVNERLRQMVHRLGAKLEAIYFCPHAPDDRCNCRKPEPGLLMRAGRDLNFEPASAVVIGDKASDMEFGRRVGARAILVTNGNAALGAHADVVVSDLDDAARTIESRFLGTGSKS